MIVREPLLWWNSARHHSKSIREKGLERYQTSLKNTLNACRQYPKNVLVASFDNLIKNTEESIKLILNSAGLKFNQTAIYPSNFPLYGKDNSTFGHKKTDKVQKNKLDRQPNIPHSDKLYIDDYLYPNYLDILKNHVVNQI